MLGCPITGLYNIVWSIATVYRSLKADCFGHNKTGDKDCGCTSDLLFIFCTIFETLCTIWYPLHNFKKVKNTHGGVLLLVKLLAEVCNFTKSNTPTWVIFTFFKLHKGYQIVQSITYPEKSSKSDRLFWERKINYTVKTPD